MDETTLKIRRRNLPHWTVNGGTYFITFRTANTQLTSEERLLVLDHLKSGAQKYYQLAAAVVMPDHVHLLIHPLPPYELPRIMKGIKGVSARKVNERRQATGSIWQVESWDRIVRDEDEFTEKLQYMADNPVKSGLVDAIEKHDGWFINPDFLAGVGIGSGENGANRNVCATHDISGYATNALVQQVELHPYPLLFATISGAHLYGFPSPDSDFDLRGIHVLPLKEVVGLQIGHETVEKSGVHDGLEIDLVTHDAKKFFSLMLKKNGYVLEQLLSPLVVHATPEHAELKEIAKDCITRHHAHHYLGFAETQWKLFEKENPPRVKPLLYVYRVLLTGIHLMQSGEIEANLLRLNETAKLPYVDELVQRKIGGAEKERLAEADLGFHRKEYDRLRARLEAAYEASALPEAARGDLALHDLLIRVRLTKFYGNHNG